VLRASVHDRHALCAGHRFDGPAIVEQVDTTVWVPPGWDASVHDNGTLVLTRQGAAGESS
jgi:N-methylhydantoinase A